MESELKMNFHRMKPDQHQRAIDNIGAKFHGMHSNLVDVIKKLMKNAKSKEKVLNWLRLAVIKNLDKQKYQAVKPVATEGFILNFIDLLLQLCKPFTNNFEKY